MTLRVWKTARDTSQQADSTCARAMTRVPCPPYDGPALFSYGFRPFFLGAALFAGAAVPAWILIVTGAIGSNFLYAPREWHVHGCCSGSCPPRWPALS